MYEIVNDLLKFWVSWLAVFACVSASALVRFADERQAAVRSLHLFRLGVRSKRFDRSCFVWRCRSVLFSVCHRDHFHLFPDPEDDRGRSHTRLGLCFERLGGR
jgi:hypothetical protein